MNALRLRLAAFAARWLPRPMVQAFYRLGPLTNWLRRLLNQAAPEGRQPVAVAGGFLRGVRLELDLRTEKDLWLGSYEPELQAALPFFLKAGMTAYDLGANLGYVTLMLASGVGPSGQVHAFEPLPDNLERLRRHLELNAAADQVRVVPAAVGAARGRVRFFVHPSAAMGKVEGSAGRPLADPQTILVDLIRLDDYVFEHGNPAPDLIEMDIEGGEGQALQGMRRVLNEVQPVVLLEVHGPEAAAAVWRELAEAGYRLHRMSTGYPVLGTPTDLPWKAYVVALPAGRLPEGAG